MIGWPNGLKKVYQVRRSFAGPDRRGGSRPISPSCRSFFRNHNQISGIDSSARPHCRLGFPMVVHDYSSFAEDIATERNSPRTNILKQEKHQLCRFGALSPYLGPLAAALCGKRATAGKIRKTV